MRILLVEDEAPAAKVLAKGLREEAYAVDVAMDGEKASEQAGLTDFDLIILDVMLPRKDGFEVCRELRAAGFTAPILMLTARDAVEDRVAGLDTGADDYLVKPFDFEELLARARALLRRKGGPLPSSHRRRGPVPRHPVSTGVARWQRHRPHGQGVCPPRISGAPRR